MKLPDDNSQCMSLKLINNQYLYLFRTSSVSGSMLRIWALLWTQQVKISCPVELVFKWAKTENKQNTQLRETYAVLRDGDFYKKK